MKKLMFAAATVAVAGGAFAAPAVFDFKANVKYMYLKRVTLSNVATAGGGTFSGSVYQKVQKASRLNGYLIQDVDGVTSPAITATTTTAGHFDYGRNRAFLVVMSSAAETGFRQPKLLPAVLDAKFIDTNFRQRHQARTGLAEGTLYVGGDALPCVRFQLDFLGPDVDSLDSRNQNNSGLYATINAQPPAVPAANTPGMVAISDYVWTSCYLFGRYNGPNFYYDVTAAAGPFEQFESAWNANLPADLQRMLADLSAVWTAGAQRASYFHDTWMNGAGIGKYIVPGDTGSLCCGLTTTSYRPTLDSLTGNLKGGIFICTDNGIDAANQDYRFFDQWQGGRDAWEAQFYSTRAVTAIGIAPAELPQDFVGDKWFADLWNDGPLEQETTDVVSGTWSIKRSTRFYSANGLFANNPLTVAETAGLFTDTGAWGTAPNFVAGADGQEGVLRAIKAAARGLQSNVTFCDGNEIYMLNRTTQVGVLPVITPKFAKYYGLVNW